MSPTMPQKTPLLNYCPFGKNAIDSTEDLSTIYRTVDSGYNPWTVLQQTEDHRLSNKNF